MMTVKHKIIKKHNAKLTPKSDKKPVVVKVDDSARLREIRKLVQENNQSTIDDNVIICQIYMESRFDKDATTGGSSAKGLMQMTKAATQQVYADRLKKQLGRTPHDKEKAVAFAQGASMHSSAQMFDEAINIQLGTEYMQYWVNNKSSISDAYKAYRGKSNGIYYQKIKVCADKLKSNPNSMQVLRDNLK